MEAEKFTSLRKAADFADVSPETIRKWCKDLGIGELEGEAWMIDKAKLCLILSARNVLGMGRAK